MSKELYNVRFKGLMPGFDVFQEGIKPEFSRRFGININTVEKLFLREESVIKKGVALEVAKRLCEVLREMGIDWEIIDSEGNVVEVQLSKTE